MSSGDCSTFNSLWGILWNPSSGEFYLPNILQNGLNAFGINIPAMQQVSVPDVGPISMWDEPVIGTTRLSMTGATLSGLPSISANNFTCDDSTPGTTALSLSVIFANLTFAGNYQVTANGLSGCAINTADTLMGWIPAAALATGAAGAAPAAAALDAQVQDDSSLADWYRDNPLQQSPTGQQLVSVYYDHQDTIQNLTEMPSSNQLPNYFTQGLQTPDTRTTTAAVRQATQDYQSGSPTQSQIGTEDQYSNGFGNNNNLAFMANAMVQMGQDPNGDYAALLQSQTAFYNHVTLVQNTSPGLQTAGDILGIVGRTPPQYGDAGAPAQSTAMLMAVEKGMPIYHPETRELVTTVYLDPSAPRRAPARARLALGNPSDADFSGTFSDSATSVTATLSATMALDGTSLAVTVTSVQASWGSLHISLNKPDGGSSLFTKVQEWIGNASFFQGIISTKLNDALSSQSTLDTLSKAITAAFNKLPG
jgi:hypothetical protein